LTARVVKFDYVPQARQKLLHETRARQIFYGGAAGGGKSTAIRWDEIVLALRNPGCQAYLFRRTLPELEDNHVRPIKREIPPEIATYNETRKTLEFYNGSVMAFCYCERDSDVERYLGAEMHVVGLDEASRMTPHQIQFLRTRNRIGAWRPSKEYEGFFPRFIMGSNPGGPAHAFLKQVFVDAAPAETLFHDKTWRDDRNPNDLGVLSIFIPAKMADNAFLDSDYAAAFSSLAPELARAYRDGDWDAVVGQALHNLTRDKHMIRPFTPPKHWTRFMSIDWGTAKPFSVGWYCVSSGAWLKGREGWPDVWLPEGAVIRYAEWYGWNGRRNQGCRMESQAVVKKIMELETERADVMDYRIGDSAMWAKTDGPSVAERMMQADARFVLRQSQKDRPHNYTEFIARLAGSPTFMEDGKEEEHPMFFVTENCLQFWATCPGLILDENDPEKGPDDKQENHVYDEVAYALRSRPYVTTESDRRDAEREEEMEKAGMTGGDPYATS